MERLVICSSRQKRSSKAGDKETTPNNHQPLRRRGQKTADGCGGTPKEINPAGHGAICAIEAQQALLTPSSTDKRRRFATSDYIRFTPESRAKRDSHVRYVPKADMPLHSRRCRLVALKFCHLRRLCR